MSERFKIFSVGDLFNLPSPRWRVQDLLAVGGFSLIYASAGHGKTFLALDLALCVASAREFHGRAVVGGPVLYVSGEGRGGLKNRVAAWMKEHSVRDVPDAFFVLEGVQFHRPHDVSELRQRIGRMPVSPQLIVIDTLARCAVGVEENEATAIGEWVESVERLQRELSVDVLVLHHAQKQQSKKEQQERGSSALIGAVGAAIRLRRRDDIVTVTCKKQKDAEEFDEFSLRMKTIDLGINEHDERVQSCVLVPADSSFGGLTAAHRKMLIALHDLGGRANRAEWRARVDATERTFDRWREQLEELKLIEAEGRGAYCLTDLGKAEVAEVVDCQRLTTRAA